MMSTVWSIGFRVVWCGPSFWRENFFVTRPISILKCTLISKVVGFAALKTLMRNIKNEFIVKKVLRHMIPRNHISIFSKIDVGNVVTVNGGRYRNILQEFFWYQLEDMEFIELWFQQEGATCHTANDSTGGVSATVNFKTKSEA